MSKKWAAVIISLLVISLGLSAVSLAVSLRQPQKQSGDIQYVLYLGTNDKDTNQPVYPPEEAKEKAKEILIRNFGGYTIQEANGGWIDDENTVYQEYTLVIYLSDTTIDKVHAAADEMIRTFNQSSVLIQANETKTDCRRQLKQSCKHVMCPSRPIRISRADACSRTEKPSSSSIPDEGFLYSFVPVRVITARERKAF